MSANNINAKDAPADALLERAYNLQSKTESKELYRDWAETYDNTMLDGLGYLTPQKTAGLLNQFAPDKNIRILDVGSGTGLAGVELQKLGYGKMDALDYSAEMLAVAGKRGIYEGLHEIDLTACPLPFETNSYDAMICTGTFTHAHVGASCLEELFRILRPEGVLACTIHKDVWDPADFDEKVSQLEADGSINTLHKQEGTYYQGTSDPEGWFIVWQSMK